MQNKIFLSMIFVCCAAFSLHAQTHGQDRMNQMAAEAAEKIFNDNDKDFVVTAIPEKWNNESAVIIAQKFTYEYSSVGLGNRVLNYVETTRRRLKILDKAAVDEFSTFYFYSSPKSNVVGYGAVNSNQDNFAIKIIKPDGSVKTINKQDAIKTDVSETPSIFKARLNTNLEYYKVALPDISAGDIIDYFLVVNGTNYNYTGGAQDLPPVLATLISDYPIMKQRIEFVVDRGFFINFKSSNGAPELKKNTNIDRNTYSFSLVDQDRPRVEDTRWLYPYRQLPTIKFQVVWAKVGQKSEFFLGKVDEPKTTVSAEEITEKVNFNINDISILSNYYIEAIKKEMKRDHRDLKSKTEVVRYAYYYFRNIAFSEYTMSIYTFREIGYMPSALFAKVMYEVLQDYDVLCDVIVVPDRSISNIGDIVIASELNYCIKAGDQYLYTFTLNSNYNDMDPDLSGQAGYLVKVNSFEKNRKAIPVTLPSSNATANSFLLESDVTFDESKENLVMQNKTTLKGLQKRSYNVVLTDYDWEKTDYLAYGGDKSDDVKAISGNKNKVAEEQRKEKAKEEENRKKLMDEMKDLVKDDFSNVVSYEDFKLISDGRSPKNIDLIYTEKYTVGDLVKKVGPNYTLDAGALIGSQVEIQEKEMKRDYDVWLSYPRTLSYKITVNLPEGYKPDGIESLNTNVDNIAGSFISTAKVEGQKLTIDVAKVYKVDFVKKEDWLKMVEFLDVAYNFTQKKIVLKKA